MSGDRWIDPEAIKDYERAFRRPRWPLFVGMFLLFSSCFLPRLTCSPKVDFKTFHVEKGMTMDEVRARYGAPRNAYKSGGTASWYYPTDPMGWGLSTIGVAFDSEGKVILDFID